MLGCFNWWAKLEIGYDFKFSIDWFLLNMWLSYFSFDNTKKFVQLLHFCPGWVAFWIVWNQKKGFCWVFGNACQELRVVLGATVAGFLYCLFDGWLVVKPASRSSTSQPANKPVRSGWLPGRKIFCSQKNKLRQAVWSQKAPTNLLRQLVWAILF